MKLIDIHSHILPNVDDGSKNLQMSLELLKLCKEQGITDIIATPHFDAQYDNIETHNERVNEAYKKLLSEINGKALPNIYIGAEVYYFNGIGKSYGARNLTLAKSNYILLELPHTNFDNAIIKDIENLSHIVGVTPIIAHIERYASLRGFKKLLALISSGTVLAQANASSLFMPHFRRAVLKLIKKGYISFVATDTHSTDSRPPMLKEALEEIEKQFGSHQKKVFLRNSDKLYNEIFGEGENDLI